MPFEFSPALLNKFKIFFKTEDDTVPSFMSFVEGKRGPANYVRYNFRNQGMEDIKKVFEVTPEQEKEMSDYFWKIFSYYIDEDKPESFDIAAKRVAEWVNRHTIYEKDISKYHLEEFWQGPYEMYKEIITNKENKMYDDCDGYAVLIVYIWKLLGIPAYRRFVATGPVYDHKGNFAGYHAYAVYLPFKNPLDFFPIEGSYNAADTNSKFLKVPLWKNLLYGSRIWFITNEKKSYRGNIADYIWR